MFTRPILLSALALSAPLALAAPKARPRKPTSKPTVRLIHEVLGTTPLTGYEGALGQTSTLGKKMPFNFTLKSAEYSVGRVNIGTYSYIPKGDEKLLVLHFTAQNPQNKSFYFSANYLAFTAVDASGVSRKYIGDIAREVTAEPVGLQLNPGQKIDAYTLIRVAAFGPVPKLIVQNAYEADAPIVRYDLRSMAKKLAPPYSDANDATGATALKTVSAQSGKWYPVTDQFDARLDAVAYSTDPIANRAAGDGKRYCIATFTIRNSGKRAVNASSSYFRADVKDADGEKTDYNTSMLKGSRDEEAYPQLAPGEEAHVRFYWPLPTTVEAKSVLLQNGYDRESRTFAFAVPASQ